MSGYTAGRPSTKQIVAATLLLTLILVEVAANPAYSSGTNTSSVGVSPGKYDLPLGNDFPTFGTVKLSYPDSAILTNSTGDLLFNVTLNPLMLNPTSAQVWSSTPSAFPLQEVQVSGSGFSPKDTSCTLSGITFAPPFFSTCSISGGILTGWFNVGNVPTGAYIITARAYPETDYSSASFTVSPPSLGFNPLSGPDGTTVSVYGVGFYTTDSSCSLVGKPVPSPTTCHIANGILTGSFTVPVPIGTYTIVALTDGIDTCEAVATFTVKPQSISITLPSPPSGPILTPVTVSGSGFSPSDTTCMLIGSIIASPSCTVSAGGVISGSFKVSSVPAGRYTITAIGSPGSPCSPTDSATTSFQDTTLPSPPISTPVTVDIYIPPDFSGLTLSQTWTSFTNNYDPHIIQLSKQSASDQIGPSWWKVAVSLTVTNHPSDVNPENQTFLTDQTQYIRLFQVASPTTAGRYFFKAFINGISIGAGNFPTLVVKASRDPAYISGVLRDLGDRNASRAGQPITLQNGTGAQVLATGLDYLGRSVSAQTFINSTADGQYTLFGVAPGTYNITAYAAGYEPATRPWTVSVAAGQSLEGVDVYLTDSVLISGTVLSKSPEGDLIPWGTLAGINSTISSFCPTATVPRAITVDLLDLAGILVASTSAPYRTTSFTEPTATSFDFGPGLPNPPIQNQVGFDGRIPQDYANYTSGLTWGDYLLQAYVTSYIQIAEVRVHVDNSTADTETVIPLIRTGSIRVTVHFRYSNNTLVDEPLTAFDNSGQPVQVGGTLTVSAYDQEGILRAQNVSSVTPGSTSAIVDLIGFSNTRGFGTFSLFSHNYGLRPGTYYIVARLTSSPSFAGFANIGIRDLYYQTDIVRATIGLSEDEVLISLSLYRAGGILLTLHSINYQVPHLNENWAYPGSTIKVLIIDSNGNVYQTNSTQPAFMPLKCSTFPYKSTNVTFAYVGLGFLGGLGGGLLSGSYTVIIETHGYTQQQILHVNVRLGAISDAAIYMILNPVIDLTIFYTHEALLSNITSTLPFAQPINNLTATPTRIEVFDDQGNFVAADATYIRNGNATAHFILSGFDLYYGDPRLIWSGFYDTTDGASQTPGGLILYPWNMSPHTYTIRIWVDGYYQLQPLRVIVTAPQNVSVVTYVDRASRIYGTVMGPDYFGAARYLSWATITLQPNNSTLTDIIDVRPGNYTTSSLDGSFQVWVPQGTYGMGVSLEGYATYSAMISVPPGSDMYMEIWLDNYQPSSQLISPVTSIATNSALSLKAHLQRVPKPWVDSS